ncbi:NAD-dependent malic enzyme, mitochondrial [Wickerhamiella sorbophila]|uniref:NAD-dependent malic enzyme, mitochondrial n=1 Tax=Wickerhamiella sorbophila TaxID=45607 RepID=A0A2T0FD56_9ASCO|nr:NAD-dependent malic enzyme, mitochondrial [Wickerhamiella sorbophila]PRT52938.1 NAD-dependent malic enzyme, mitochondrial [Wickerhamiella sorbophila]
MRASLIRLARHTRLTREPFVDVAQTGQELLNNFQLNKGSAFSNEERRIFKMGGLLPTAVHTLDDQLDRAYNQFHMYPTDLLKNSFCESLKVQNETLYYALMRRHLKEMMRIIYTPTQGDAIANYSQLFRRPAGCFLDINQPDDIAHRMAHYGDAEDIDYICVTDAEGILGIGDQGVGGIGIAISKLVLMTVCGGIHPNRVIPVVLDCGTNNQKLLQNPLYMGNRHERVRGERYDKFLDNFVQTVKQRYPRAVLHFEDFGTAAAYKSLDLYRDQLPCFNDDIQGTGAVTLSALAGALHSTDRHMPDARTIIFGAGSAGCGIANQMVDKLVENDGLSRSEARKNIFLIDRNGLITSDMRDLMTVQREYAVDPEDPCWKDIDRTSLLELVKAIQPHILIGCSTRPGSFTKEVVQEMCQHVDRPIILPLSNPTRLHEAQPSDLIEWTDGRVLLATGSPFDDVHGRRISENNNCFIFPGIGLGAVLSRASTISKGMIAAAIDELATMSPVLKDPNGPLLPDISEITDISARVATSVVLRARDEGLARVEDEISPVSAEKIEIPADWDECYIWVLSQMWQPEYHRYRRAKTVH